MAISQHIIANVYGKNGNQLDSKTGTANGRINYFPYNGNHFYTAPANTVYAGVTCNSIIEVWPSGLNQFSDKYYCVETIVTLASNAT